MAQRRKFFGERMDPANAPLPLSLDEVKSLLDEALRTAWKDAAGIFPNGLLAVELRGQTGISEGGNIFWHLPSMKVTPYFTFVEFLIAHQSDMNRRALERVVAGALAYYGDGYRLDDKARIIATGKAGLAELLEKPTPATETEQNRQKLDEAVYLFRRAGSTRLDKKDAVERLGEIIEWHKQDFDKVVPKKEKDRLGEFLNGFSIRHHGKDQEDEYPDAWLDSMFVRALATVHLYWELKAKEAEG